MSAPCGRTEIFDFEGGGEILLIVIPNLFRNLLNFWDPETSSGWHWCSVFKITTSLRIGYFILCSVTAPRIKRDSEPADLSCRQPIFSAGCFALCSACFPRNELLGVRGKAPDDSSHLIIRVFLFRFYFLFLHRNQKEKVNKENYEILRQFALALNGYGSAFILEFVRPQYDKMDWRFTPIH